MLHDEDKGIGFSRGLSPDGCQTFEMFLPPDTAVQLSNGHVAAEWPSTRPPRIFMNLHGGCGSSYFIMFSHLVCEELSD